MRRHSKRQWKLEQNSDYWGDYGRDGCELPSCVTEGGLIMSSLRLGSHPTRFWITKLSQKDTGSRGIT
jgi:hypothetical protein